MKLNGELLQHAGPAVLKLNTGNLIEIPAQRRGDWGGERGCRKQASGPRPFPSVSISSYSASAYNPLL